MAENSVLKEIIIRAKAEGVEESTNALEVLQVAVDSAGASGKLTGTEVGKLTGTISKLEGSANTASGSVNNATQSIISLRYANYDLANTLLGTAAAITAIGAATLTAFASQERAFADVERTLETGTAPERIEAIESALQSLSTQIPLTFNQLSEIATIGNQMGIAANDLEGFTTTVARFSAITGISVEATTKAFGGFMAQTGLAPRYLENLGSAIAKVGIDSNATEEQILSLMREITAGATGAGFAAEQIVGLSGTLASLQIAPERARGALTTYFGTLNKAVAGGGKDLENFAQIVGITSEELERLVRSGEGNKVLEGFLRGLQDLDSVDTTRALNELGLAQLRVDDTFRRLSGSLGLYVRDQKNADVAFQESTELQRQHGFITETLAAKFQMLLNAVMNLAAQVGSEFAPAFIRLIDIAKGAIITLTEFVESPIGGAITRTVGLLAAAATVWLSLRGAIALATASTLAFATISGSLGGAGIINGLKGLSTAFLSVRDSSGAATTGVLTLRGALMALGRAVVIGAVLSYIAEWLFAPGEAAKSTGEALIWMANTAVSAVVTLAQAMGPLAQIIGAFAVDSVVAPLRSAGKWFLEVAKTAPKASTGIGDLSGVMSGLAGGLDGFNSSAPEASNNMDDLGGSAAGAAQQVRTLLDYAGDLAKVWDRAFEIRFSGQSTLDAITSSFISIQEAADAAAKRIRDLNNDISKLNSDISIQEYFLSIAIEYGDLARSQAIEADLAKKRAELADKTAELQKEQDAASKSLVGNSKGAIENRKTIMDLVKQYQSHLQALAASGASQAQLAQATARLKQDFYAQATQLGYNRNELDLYAAAFDDVSVAIANIPPVNIDISGLGPAQIALREMQAAINAVTNNGRGYSIPISTQVDTASAARAARLADLQRQLANAQMNMNSAIRSGADNVALRWMDQIARLSALINSGSYAQGGYTGAGGKYEPAGIVHKGEYVIPKHMVNQSTGLPYADALGRLTPGVATKSSYASGGFVNPPVQRDMHIAPGSIEALANAVSKVLVVDGKVLADSSAKVYGNETVTGSF